MKRNWNALEEAQPIVMRILKNALQRNRVAHAYLFEGLKGTGKKEVATTFAKSLFCHHLVDGYQPCEQCPSCKRINNGNHPDLHIIEPDGASIKKEQIHFLQQEFSKKAVESSIKVYIINHADKMTMNAANSLLKFLEEPGQQTTAILITEQIHKILPTIYSRCQHISFKPLSKEEMILRLKEMGLKPERANLLANLTNSIDEAYELKDDEWLLQARKIVLKLYEIIDNKPMIDALLYIQSDWLNFFKTREQMDIGLDMLLFIYRDILSVQLEVTSDLVFPDYSELWKKSALHMSSEKLTMSINYILDAKRRLQANVNNSLLMEQLIIKLQEGLTIV